jgi:hypothetical protein
MPFLPELTCELELKKFHQTKQNKTKQNKTKQNKTKQNKTKQNKTKQNKTKQNKTKQNKKMKQKNNRNQISKSTIERLPYINNIRLQYGLKKRISVNQICSSNDKIITLISFVRHQNMLLNSSPPSNPFISLSS